MDQNIPQGNPNQGPAATSTPPSPAPAAPADWRSAIPEDVRSHPALSSFKDVGALAKSYVEAQKMIGGSVRIPGPNAKPEEVAAFRAKLGVPESPDKYELRVNESVRGILDEKIVGGFRQAAHKLGIPPQAAQGLLDWYSNVLAEGQRSIVQQAKVTEAELKAEWGDALYDRNIALAQRVVREMGGDELMMFLDQTGLGNSVPLIKMLARVGHLLAEDGHVPGEVEGILSADEAKRKIAEVMADPNHPYHAKNASKPGHADAVAEMSRLFQVAYPSV